MKVGSIVLASILGVVVVTGSVSGQQKPSQPRPNAYGISTDSAYHIGYSEFTPVASSIIFVDRSVESSPTVFSRYITNCFVECLVNIPHLPDGALLTGIRFYFCESNPADTFYVDIYKTLFDGTAPTLLTSVTNGGESGGCGGSNFLDLTSLDYQVNYQDNQLVLFGRFTNGDGSQSLAGVTLYYRLQVSPAPGSATFGDVPTSSPQFQFVEALVAAGITSGCGGGNYCPNNPVTRGQMAVFLAKALGLQWQ